MKIRIISIIKGNLKINYILNFRVYIYIYIYKLILKNKRTKSNNAQ